jgi:hypothetical protein
MLDGMWKSLTAVVLGPDNQSRSPRSVTPMWEILRDLNDFRSSAQPAQQSPARS